MNVIREGFHAGREAFWIGLDVALRVATDLPAIVDDEVDVAGVAHAACHHRVGHRLDQILAGVGPADKTEDNCNQYFHSVIRTWMIVGAALCGRPSHRNTYHP